MYTFIYIYIYFVVVLRSTCFSLTFSRLIFYILRLPILIFVHVKKTTWSTLTFFLPSPFVWTFDYIVKSYRHPLLVFHVLQVMKISSRYDERVSVIMITCRYIVKRFRTDQESESLGFTLSKVLVPHFLLLSILDDFSQVF